MKNDATPIPNQPCRKCGYVVEATSEAFGRAKPKAGDYSMCLACGDMTIFNADLTRRNPTRDEALEISFHPQVMHAQVARSAMVGDKIKERNEA